MKSVVVTGSTRGIGFSLARSFLDLGCAVTVSGRTAEAVDKAVAQLSLAHEADRICSHPCDVTDFDQVQALWDAAKDCFGKIDIWINNAGIGHPQTSFWSLSAEQIRSVVSTNLIGAMYGSKVALRGMLDQGFGALYNMEGLGSGSRRVDGLALYASTKCALRHLDESLARDVRGTPVLAGALRPGMVATDFLRMQFKDRQEDWERAKRIFNILADRPDTVAPLLARRVLANTKNGVCFNLQSGYKVLFRFLAAPFRKRELFD
jgi:NAD(P)-dependent dehydrogenase (short-subunit alcohol dehydrogenase family)